MPPPTFCVPDAGLLAELAVSAAAATTVMATVCVSFPSGPVHSNVREPLSVRGPTITFPSVGWSPLQLSTPLAMEEDAVQVSASTDDHAKVTESLDCTVSALVLAGGTAPLIALQIAPKITFGQLGAATATVASCVVLPPGPLHDREYVVVVLSFLNVLLPDVS